ncbi:MAG: molybdopterin-dependent oxidoreductase [Xanthobacteraceae bacterium]|nr:molybdopterin-dependent oxidoreductase [Xanthobacteraceae bacterium]
MRPEPEGEWVQGWPDRKRARLMPSKDAEGRTVFARTPLDQLEGLITPTDAFYIVTQLTPADPIHPDDYVFSITGLVDRPLELKLSDLQKLPTRTVRAVTECAGDDADWYRWQKGVGKKPSRILRPQVEQGGWNNMSNEGEKPTMEQILEAIPSSGVVSGGEWTGVSLHEVLKRAGVKPEATCVHIIGYDEGRPDPTPLYMSTGRMDIEYVDPGVINYDKALELSKALHEDTILAWAMNGEFLQHVHGAPLRMVVPGWSGNWWVKWIKEIQLLDYTPECYYQNQYFVLGDSPDDPNRKPCKQLGCKSIITYPVDEDSPLPKGEHAIRGLAWSGEGAITRVEVSVDDGKTWQDAHIEQHGDRWLWRRWMFLWEAKQPGKYVIKARATDENGRVQPQQPWNYQQKHFDGITPVDVEII